MEAGQRERVDAIVEAHAVDVHRYLRRRLAGSADPVFDADDLTAEVFVVAWRRRADIPDEALPWLYGVARRVLANHRRRRIDIPVDPVDAGGLEDADALEGTDPAELVTDDAVLAQAWLTLSARDREVLRLAAWEGLDGAGLAAALGIGVGGAGAALSRARTRLAEALAVAEA